MKHIVHKTHFNSALPQTVSSTITDEISSSKYPSPDFDFSYDKNNVTVVLLIFETNMH